MKFVTEKFKRFVNFPIKRRLVLFNIKFPSEISFLRNANNSFKERTLDQNVFEATQAYKVSQLLEFAKSVTTTILNNTTVFVVCNDP